MCGSWGSARKGRGEGEIHRPGRRHWCAFVAAFALLCAPAALASRGDDPPLPWAGGIAVETPFETFAGDLASMVAGRPVRVICNGATDWGQLAAQQRFDAVTVWGFVIFNYDALTEEYHPADYMQLSEAACWYLDQFWRSPSADKGKMCRVATQIAFQPKSVRVKVTKRVKVKGRWTTRVSWVTKTTQVPVQVPKYGICPDYMKRVFALQTISHEAQHLAGIQDEALAECNGMQRLGWFAQRFGGTGEQAQQMAGDYYNDFYETTRPGTPYYMPTCPNPVGR
jgi:hypothetical protein